MFYATYFMCSIFRDCPSSIDSTYMKQKQEGAYIKKYLPVLAKMPTKYIYEPWKARLDYSVHRCKNASASPPLVSSYRPTTTTLQPTNQPTGAQGGAGASGLRHRAGLPVPHRRPRRRFQGIQHEEHKNNECMPSCDVFIYGCSLTTVSWC